MRDFPVLYRCLADEVAVTNHLKGYLWFRSPKFFRSIEGRGNDPLEGIGSYILGGSVYKDIGDDRPIQPAFLISFSEIILPEYGKYVLKLENPNDLSERVKSRLPKGSNVYWRKIKYDKVEELYSEPSPTEGWNRKFFSKPSEFESEKEWRLVVFLPMPLRLLNDTLEPCVGNLQGIFRLQCIPESVDDTCLI